MNAGLGGGEELKSRGWGYRHPADLQSAGWRRLVGMHERRHKERLRLSLEQLGGEKSPPSVTLFNQEQLKT